MKTETRLKIIEEKLAILADAIDYSGCLSNHLLLLEEKYKKGKKG